MISFNHVRLRRGPHLVFEDLHLAVTASSRVGVVGRNGAGKTSLLGLVTGALHPDAGEVVLPRSVVISHVAQETAPTDRRAIEHVIDGDPEFRNIERALEHAQAVDDGTRQAELHARLDAIDGYRVHARAGRLMHGLGFSSSAAEVAVRTLSGGWRMRLNLAQALMCRSDILLLDEPTNHLDLDAVLWLEEWLRSYSGTLLLISHDREFLDPIVEQVARVFRRTAKLYTGNYSAYERLHAEELAREQAVYRKQQRRVVRMRRFVERFRYKASKARQAQSRLKALQRLQLIAPAHLDSPFEIDFEAPDKLPRPLLRLESVAAGYGGAPVLEGVDMSLAPGDRVGLLGANGAGKSTLVKVLAARLAPEHGRCEVAAGLEIGYFAQQQLELLDFEASPLQHLQRTEPGAREQEIRGFLGGLGFGGERADRPVEPLSGGEKARLMLALIVRRRPNLLLLDEPTNHLDLDLRHALTMALQDFQGAVVLVSHDRHLLRVTCDDLWLVAGGSVQRYAGDLDDYARELRSSRHEPGVRSSAVASRDARARRRGAATRRRELHPLKVQVQRLEAALQRLHDRKRGVDRQLADPELYHETDPRQVHALRVEQSELERAVSGAERDWLEASERFEAARVGAGADTC